MRCDGPFEKIVNDIDKSETENSYTKSAETTSTGSEGQAVGNSNGINGQIDNIKMEWLIKVIREMKNEMLYKSEIKNMIRQIIREELAPFKREMEVMTEEKQKEAIENKRKEWKVIVKNNKRV